MHNLLANELQNAHELPNNYQIIVHNDPDIISDLIFESKILIIQNIIVLCGNH